MTPERHAKLVEWLSSPDNPPVRYLTARDLVEPAPSRQALRELRGEILDWEPLRTIGRAFQPTPALAG